MSELTSHVLRVAEVRAETGDACSVVFDPTPEQAEYLDYRPGQFLTVRVPSEWCGSVARCYSLSSSPYTDSRPQVTVKRTEDGYASHWICDNLTAGSEMEILPPSGIFTPQSFENDLLLLAGGSGITPVMSIVKSMLAHGTGKITLFYANRDENSVIFAGELRELAAAYPDRFVVIHWLETVQGLPNQQQLQTMLAPFTDREAFICGPNPFMKACNSALKAMDVPRGRIHREKFVSLGGNPFEQNTPTDGDSLEPAVDTDDTTKAANGSAPTEDTPGDDTAPAEDAVAQLSVDLDGTQHSFSWPRQQKLLDFMLEQGLDAPYSCREGQCSACACRLVSGEVKMLHNEILEAEDLDEGIVLACQSLPITDEVSISYE